MISGLTLDSSPDALARLYYRTAVAIALGTRHILDALDAKGWRIDTLHVAGGHTKNPLLMELYADTTGCRVIEPAEDAVLLGAAMTAAVAAGLQPSLAQAAAAMSRSAGMRGHPTRPSGRVRSRLPRLPADARAAAGARGQLAEVIVAALDLDRLRADTPGVRHRVHLNNAGAGLMPRPVLDAMTGHLRREAEIGGYEAAAEAAEALDGVYASVARLIGAERDEIALTENATVAWQMAFYALAATFRPGDRILTARAEYAANYVAFLQMAQRTGVAVEVIPDDADGVLDPAALQRMIDDRVRLIAITWIPTNGGLVNPAAEVGRIARAAGMPYLLDACQAVGQMPVDVDGAGLRHALRDRPQVPARPARHRLPLCPPRAAARGSNRR